MITIKRAYEKAQISDGRRVLVDRLWPRGLAKARAKLDAWEKELAPSSKLRTWFGHKPERFVEFKKRYKTELRSRKKELQALKKSAKRLTLVYAAKDEVNNHAPVLKDVLDKLR